MSTHPAATKTIDGKQTCTTAVYQTRRYREWKAAVLEGEEAQAGLIDRAKLVLLQVYSSHLY